MARSLWRRPKHFSPQSHVFLSATSQTRRWLRGVCFVPCSQTYKIHLRPLCAVWWVLVACSMCEDRYCVEYKSGRLWTNLGLRMRGCEILCRFLSRIHNKKNRGHAMVMMYLWDIQSRKRGSIFEEHQHKAEFGTCVMHRLYVYIYKAACSSIQF